MAELPPRFSLSDKITMGFFAMGRAIAISVRTRTMRKWGSTLV